MDPDKSLLFIKLSWWIVEQRYIYYHLDGNHPEAVDDFIYDAYQKKYVELGEELGQDTDYTLAPGCVITRSSVQCVARRLTSNPMKQAKVLLSLGHPRYGDHQ